MVVPTMHTPSTSPTSRRAVIAFGSNVGDRERNINSALKELARHLKAVSCSGLYETAPMYVEDQPAFLNGALVVETDLSAERLLRVLKDTEAAIGRQARERNGPREIDLDLIDIDPHRAGEEPTGTLTVPHPRAHERRFVLEPLNEIAPDWLLKGYGRVRDLLVQPDVQSQEVRRTADAPIFL